jgi:hypothetical protein
MSFFLRKALRMGPVRFNLSKSGVGVSVGVKGARIGINPKGRAYVHAGRGGFYFRETLSPPPSQRRDGPTQPSPRVPSTETTTDGPVQQIESGTSWSLTDDGQAHLVAELTRVHKRSSTVLFVAVVGAMALVGLGAALVGSLNVITAEAVILPPTAWVALLLIAAVCFAFAIMRARAVDEREGKVNLSFDLEPEAAEGFRALSGAMNRVSMCQRVWAVETQQRTGDWKRNAGATNLIKRTRVEPSPALPKGVESSHEIMCLPAGRQKLYFFPNALMIYDAEGVGAISFSRVKCEVRAVAFTEEEQVPTDAPIVRRT